MKIGFCFLIKNTINNILFWGRYFENISNQDYQIFIHPKDTNYQCPLQNSIILKNTSILTEVLYPNISTPFI